MYLHEKDYKLTVAIVAKYTYIWNYYITTIMHNITIHKYLPIYAQKNHHSYCAHLCTNTYTYFTRITFTSHWSQRELLVGSVPVQLLLNHLPIFLMHKFLLNQLPTSHLHPSTRKSQTSLLTKEGLLQPQKMEVVFQALHSLPPALYL